MLLKVPTDQTRRHTVCGDWERSMSSKGSQVRIENVRGGFGSDIVLQGLITAEDTGGGPFYVSERGLIEGWSVLHSFEFVFPTPRG